MTRGRFVCHIILLDISPAIFLKNTSEEKALFYENREI